MKIEWLEDRYGRYTSAVYYDENGNPVATKVVGWMDEATVRAYLKCCHDSDKKMHREEN